MRPQSRAVMYACTVVLCLFTATAGRVQAAAQLPAAYITNVTVAELTRAGVAPETIAHIVRATASRFDLSQPAVDALRKSGVADSVIAAMVQRGADNASAVGGRARIQEVAFALEKQDAAGISLIAMAAAPYSSAMSYGLFSVGNKVIVPGRIARVETSEPVPTFRVELPPGRKPTDFILSKFQESDEGGARQINPESSLLFDAQRVAEGVYRLTPREPLRRGEYAFYMTDSTGGPQQVRMAIYDFRIVRH